MHLPGDEIWLLDWLSDLSGKEDRCCREQQPGESAGEFASTQLT
jgi:hypothetical protein